jgi:3D (Asp-Asp-Asp) domain-containing protein/septal ring factor EnvC (AmiA/AmiB activator)
VRASRQTLRSVALASCAAVLICIALPAAVVGAPGGQSAASLSAHRTQLERRSHDALLELYSIETQLERARSRISLLDRQEARLERENAVIRTNLRQARSAIAATQHVLADRALALYESGDTNNTIAIMLGAQSVDDAVTRLEDIEQIVNQQNSILLQAQRAQARLLHLRAGLAERKAALDRLRSATVASVRSLEAARSDRANTIHRLSSERALTSRQLTSLSAQATKAATTSVKSENQSASTSPHTTSAGPGTTSDSSGGPVSKGQQLTVSATCYCLRGNTASGLPVGPGIIATDPSVIPLGTRVYVPGYGNAVAADTGSAVKGLTIDLWVASCAKASAFGRQTLTIKIL